MKQGDISASQDLTSENIVRGKGLIREYLSNIGEIVESDGEEITLNFEEE
jgi:hypothetical protein